MNEPHYAPLPRTPHLELYLWMVEHGVSVKQLASDVRVSEMSVSRWRNGSAKPARFYAQKLERITRGRISVASWDACSSAAAAE